MDNEYNVGKTLTYGAECRIDNYVGGTRIAEKRSDVYTCFMSRGELSRYFYVCRFKLQKVKRAIIDACKETCP